jgi:hypothetical protein
MTGYSKQEDANCCNSANEVNKVDCRGGECGVLASCMLVLLLYFRGVCVFITAVPVYYKAVRVGGGG